MNTRALALIAVSIATLIYGLNYTIAKDVMPLYMKPYGFILLELWSNCYFLVFRLVCEIQKIEKGDYKKILLAAFFGVALNMLAFFKGLSLTTPISASVMMVISPIMVLFFLVYY